MKGMKIGLCLLIPVGLGILIGSATAQTALPSDPAKSVWRKSRLTGSRTRLGHRPMRKTGFSLSLGRPATKYRVADEYFLMPL
jgi:hypothetical protein